ncbi:Rrf2 family transcriptional regulator [Patescibacteria group bacterium]|nr:Rrf2 family transcriptional regulator [Patescibacteria group bacterium]
MKISTKTRYGLIAMIYLKNNKLSSIKKISKEEKIPEKYLAKIFLTLKKATLLKVKRGTTGGYFLSKPANQIKIGQIIKALEKNFLPVACMENTCSRQSVCKAKKIWFKIYKTWFSSLNSLTLADA